MISRLILGAGLLLFAITTTSFVIAAVLSVMAAVILRLLDDNWITTLRLLRLLRWFVIPIVLLHLLFTPGQLLLPGWPVAASLEGLMQGLWLSLHLITIYIMAMLMFRLLKQREWLGLLIRLPGYGEQLLIRVLMLLSMKKQMTALLLHLRQQYRLRHDWQQLPLLFMAVFSRALTDAVTHAQILWLRWPQQASISLFVSGKSHCTTLSGLLFSMLWVVCGGAGLLLPWLT